MSNGYSSLFRNLGANVFAAVILFVGAVFGLLSGFFGWLGVILFALVVLIFFIEQNPFVRRACFLVMLLQVVTIVSWLLFRLILPWKFFTVVDWVIHAAIICFLVIAGLRALNGKTTDLPFAGKLIDSVCK